MTFRRALLFALAGAAVTIAVSGPLAIRDVIQLYHPTGGER